MPECEAPGCPRGASFSWYEYSPLRVKYPYRRGKLWAMRKEAMHENRDPLKAWASIVGDREKAETYKKARGEGGHVRADWPEATKLMAALLLHTIQKYGPAS